MNDWYNYLVRIAGGVDEHEVNAMSPLEMKLERAEADSTWLSVHTDQSGLIGLMRHLHGLGFVLLCVDRSGADSLNNSGAYVWVPSLFRFGSEFKLKICPGN